MTLRRFQVECLRKILALNGVELALLIIDDRDYQPSSFSSKLKTISRVKNTFWPIFTRLIRLEQDSPLSLADASAELDGIPQIRCRIYKKGKFSEYFEDADLDKIREHKIDFIIKFAFGILRGGILTVARYGVWSYHHDDPDKYRGIPPAFWEVYHGDPVSGAILQRLTEKLDGGIVLRKYFVKTVPYSYKQNLSSILKATVDMPSQVIRDILHGQAEYVDAAPCSTGAPIYRVPTNLQVMQFGWRCATRFLRDQWKGLLWVDSWNVGIVDEPIARFTDPAFKPQVRWLPYKRSKAFIADPFFEAIDPGAAILAEEFDHDQNRGYIVRMKVDGDKLVSTERVLDDGKHLSYPYTFEHTGLKYMIPESSLAKEVALHRVGPNGELTRVATLIENFRGLDASVVQHQGRWWLFASDADGPCDANLMIWYAEDIFGPWIPHALNPVKMDVRSSRPAGTPFLYNGDLYRPAQNGSVTYGGSTVINRVTCLTPTKFAEEVVNELQHDRTSKYRIGFHTLAAGNGCTLVDGRCDEIHPALITRKLIYKLRRIFGQAAYSDTRVSGYAADAASQD